MARAGKAAQGAGTRLHTGLEGAGWLVATAALVAALVSYHPGDPSLNVATGASPNNWLGYTGAAVADLLLQALGLAAAILLAPMAAAGVRRLIGQSYRHAHRRWLAAFLAAVAAASALALSVTGPEALPAGPGGLTGRWLAGAVQSGVVSLPAKVPGALALGVATGLLAILAVALLFLTTGLSLRDLRPAPRARAPRPMQLEREPAPVASAAEPGVAQADEPERRMRIFAPKPEPRKAREQLPLPLDAATRYQLPGLKLLAPAPPNAGPAVDAATLEANAKALEGVLADYGVQGEITQVRPGPVVTMYELEPAPGIKASRVIGLADDIARSMSAVSARVAVVPGRTIIGIELPNRSREMVVLSELLASEAYADQKAVLPLVLGKNIAGDPVVADLAPMPHLLIAGTTGSGKSVGLNCMILSLLYRLTPEQCRLIMIDPKMLELSVYDGIPHLLSPVVTEPPKAIRALKWAVEQMEERYRMMAAVGVRSLSGFNQRVRDARVEGKPFVRRVQTGYGDDGVPVFEEQSFDFEPLPHIVIVVDELADLMMVAGKEIEFLIQRLAQKARAAGIHLIMATQRPSVDVITGVIKANLPTRISFQVTSKIDSRTILGEQGAEQLLGRGDMLYMPGGKQVARVHGPFVSDEEVEAVAVHWRAQGAPDYVDAVTEEPPAGDDLLGFDGFAGGEDEEGDLYRRAVQVVAESQKASTSYVQRQLRVGYNNAARLIERMEKDGYVGPADHVGRREVLVDAEGNRL